MKTIYLVINTQFAAVHHWPLCDIEHSQSYLRHPHRHLFFIRMKWQVSHENRELEFIELKNQVDDFLRNKYDTFKKQRYSTPFVGSTSCEELACILLEAFPNAFYCRVMEDNENGAEVIISRPVEMAQVG
jgi:hypothetical protein